jgi:hypothetical protein
MFMNFCCLYYNCRSLPDRADRLFDRRSTGNFDPQAAGVLLATKVKRFD